MRKVSHPRFPDYLVREDGFVERAVDSRRYPKAGDILQGRVLVSGYRQFKLRDADGEARLVRANRLVCEAYHGPAPSETHQAAHKDGDRLNNVPSNLYWATPKQNQEDAARHGTAVRGEAVVNQYGAAKLSAESVLKIRRSYTGKRGDLVRLAREYGVKPSCIRSAALGNTWGHVPHRSALAQKERRA